MHSIYGIIYNRVIYAAATKIHFRSGKRAAGESSGMCIATKGKTMIPISAQACISKRGIRC